MALRVRKNGRILCAAKSNSEKDDIYIDDAVHGWLTNCYDFSINILESIGENESGEEEWVIKKK